LPEEKSKKARRPSAEVKSERQKSKVRRRARAELIYRRPPRAFTFAFLLLTSEEAAEQVCALGLGRDAFERGVEEFFFALVVVLDDVLVGRLLVEQLEEGARRLRQRQQLRQLLAEVCEVAAQLAVFEGTSRKLFGEAVIFMRSAWRPSSCGEVSVVDTAAEALAGCGEAATLLTKTRPRAT
jgi:hypothetical protein